MTMKTRGRWFGLGFLALAFINANAGYTQAPAGVASASDAAASEAAAIAAARPAAEALARESFPAFLAGALGTKSRTLDGAAVRVRRDGRDIWLDRIAADGAGHTGRVMSTGEDLRFDAAEVVDWSYDGFDGRIYGNFSARAAMKVLPPHRAAMLAATLSITPLPARW